MDVFPGIDQLPVETSSNLGDVRISIVGMNTCEVM